jgi:hypothetical protein
VTIILFTLLAFVVSLVLTAIAVSFVVFYLVGPHGGVLPASFYQPILVLAWMVVLIVPIISARWMWRYLAKLVGKSGTKS